MPQNLFAVVLTKEQERGAARLRRAYPESAIFQLDENAFVITGDTLSSDVARAAGVGRDSDDEGIRGVVFKLNGSYSGFATPSLWEWLEKAEEGE